MSPLVYRRLSDEQLGGRLARGEASAFDELYRRYAHRLAAYGAHLLGDGAAGDDVAQSTMLKAYGALRDGRVPAQVRPWLYRIAHNVAVDLVRRRREVPAESLPDVAAAGQGETGALVAALATLPDRQRHAYVLRELHGLRIDETAAELGLTVPQVEQALFAARNRLAEHLVFGDRLNCASVRRLAAGPLDLAERRALKTHLRSCPACRGELGLRGRALGTLPLAPAEWLQWLGGLLAGGGAPVAAKVGVIAAAATVAAGVPLAVDRPGHVLRAVPDANAAVGQRPKAKAEAVAKPKQTAVEAAPPVVTTQPVAAPPPAPAPVHAAPLMLKLAAPGHEAQHEIRHERSDTRSTDHRDGGDGGGEDTHVTRTAIPVTAIGQAAPTTAPAVTTTTTPAPTVTWGSDGGSGGGGSSSDAGSSGSGSSDGGSGSSHDGGGDSSGGDSSGGGSSSGGSGDN